MAQNVDIETRVERTIANLERHNFSAVFVTNESQFHAKIKEWVPESSTVGDSVTLFETGVIELLRNGKYNFHDKYRAEITREEKKQIYRQSFGADTFLCSTNALTEEGELFYGPEQVIVVTGINKSVEGY